MRGLAVLVALALAPAFAPVASAEFGVYDAHGYPVAVDGTSTYPAGVPPAGVAAAPVNVVGPLTVYPYYPVLTAEVQRLASEHPDIVKLHSMGKSTLGLDLWMLEIADHAAIEAGEGLPLEEREVVWVDGGTHSNEYSGVYFTAHLASFLVDEYGTNETATWIVENRHVWIAPLVNPDGSHAFGRLNAHLVNINRNYPVVWDGEGHDELMNNRGPEPASEPETQLNIEWFNKTRPDYYASVHCCGNLWLYPYGEEGVDPADNATLARVCAEAFPEVVEDCGPIWSTIYPASGSSVDTVYEYTGAVAFGYEMSGRGAVAMWGQPFTSESVEVQEIESWNGVMHALLNVHLYGGHPEIVSARALGDGLEVVVRNDGYGPLLNGTLTAHLGRVAAEGSEVPADLVASTAALPAVLAPGETSTLRVAGGLFAGDVSLRIDYQKRLAAAPMGVLGSTLTLRHVGDGYAVVALDGDALLEGAALGEGPSPVPAVAPVALLGLLLVVALARRR